jgi:fucose 4-O-acetylase-like acetyltransferase
MKERILYFDLVKAFAVLLMVIGHVTAVYDTRGYLAPVNIWIYSFHMPLFMTLSGVFFGHTLKRNFGEILKSKAILLLVPLCSWSLINLVLDKLVQADFSQWGLLIKDYVFSGGPLRGLWYLKCLFMYLIACSLAVKWVKHEVLAMVLTILLFYILPDFNFSSIMIPFFWMGHFLAKMLHKPANNYLLIAAGLAMLITISFWNPEYAYINRNKMLLPWLMNFITGASASLFWILLFKKILADKKQSKLINGIAGIGMSSLGIYVMQEYFYYPHFWGWLTALMPANATLFYIVWSLMILIITYVLVNRLSKTKWSALLLLGNSAKN